jgi:hypothetical protein
MENLVNTGLQPLVQPILKGWLLKRDRLIKMFDYSMFMSDLKPIFLRTRFNLLMLSA